MAFQMDPGEILREYNAAAGKDKQIQILAELNTCRPLEIALCLREQGATLTGTWKARLAAHDRAGMRMELPKDGKEAGPASGDTSSGASATFPSRGRQDDEKAGLTAGALQELLAAVPGDTPVQICGHPGQATAALFIMRADSRGTGFVLRIQREE